MTGQVDTMFLTLPSCMRRTAWLVNFRGALWDCLLSQLLRVRALGSILERDKICLSTCAFIVDKNRNICVCRRVPNPEKVAGWGVPGKGAISNKEMRADMIENLKKDIGLTISMREIEGFEPGFFYESTPVVFKPVYLHQSISDRNNAESLSISSHELILFYYLQIDKPHEELNLVMSNTETDCIAWLPPDCLESILEKKNKKSLFTCSMIKHKKNQRKKIEYSTLFPNYPNMY